MLKSKQFVHRTKRGNILKVVKEHYLRDDIPCGSAACPSCMRDGGAAGALATIPRAIIGMFAHAPHYIIPDTNIFLNHMDVFEHPMLCDVIVLQTVLEEVRHQNAALHDRLRKLIAENPDRRFFVFSNEHCRDTFVEKLPGETPNDRNDRAIRVACSHYNQHLVGTVTHPVTVLITDDAENRRRAIDADKLFACSIRQYIESLPDNGDLLDIVARSDADAASSIDQGDKKFAGYAEHLTPLQINHGIKANTLLQGSLNIAQYNYLEGSIYAQIGGVERSVLIIGRTHLNRAVHGDIVVVQLLPESEWRRTPTVVVQDESEEAVEDDDEAQELKASATHMDVDKDGSSTAEPTGRIVGIVRRQWRQYCGYLDPRTVRANSAATWQNVLLFPMDRRIPKIRLRTRQADRLLGQRILVAIDSWATASRYPLGHFVRALGAAGDRAAETEVLLLEHDVAYHEFSKAVLSSLPSEGESWVVREEHFQGRRDLRQLNICSIDPPGCTDIDDALHVYELPNGNYNVGVHIADVTHFVRPGTAMDVEAASRGTTVYLVDKRIDMLPSLLGTNLCSLRSNVERLAFSCLWELTPDAEIVNVEFTKSVIASKASLTYEQAQNRIDDASMKDDLTNGIRVLNQLAKKLRARRIERGALTLSSPEVRFQLENDSQDPVDVEMKELKETNALVEEFMLLANISVAMRIKERFPETAMLRRHPTPPATNFEKFVKAVARMGIDIRHSTSKELSESLDAAVMADEPYFNKLLRILTTRCMMQARYFPAGAEPDTWHYGLATEIYTHFTSPIRRYADVVVHRQLAVCINAETAEDSFSDTNRIRQLTDNLNYRHRNAQQASRSSVELYTHLFFRGKVVEEEAWVVRVLKNGFVALIPRYGIEGIVYTSTPAPGDASSPATALVTYDADEDALISASVTIRLFSKVTVRVTVESEGKLSGSEGAPGMREKLRVMLVVPSIPGLSVSPMEADAVAKAVGKVRKGEEMRAEEEHIIKKIRSEIA